MKLPNSCQLRAPLFTEDDRKEVLRLVEMARTGHTLNYNSIFDHFPGEKTPLGQPDSRVIENLMTALSFKSDTGTYDPLRSGYPSNHVKILLEFFFFHYEKGEHKGRVVRYERAEVVGAEAHGFDEVANILRAGP